MIVAADTYAYLVEASTVEIKTERDPLLFESCDPLQTFSAKSEVLELLALADEMEEFGNLPVKHPGIRVLHNDDFSRELGYARRIREAVGS